MMIPAIIAERRRWLVSVRAEDQTRRGLVRFKLDFDNVHPTRCLFEVTRQSGDGRDQSGDLLSRNPITGIAGGCARAASGHAAAAPPSAASNSRSPMVTVIRPSRARCVKPTVPRHQRAVFTFKERPSAAMHRCSGVPSTSTDHHARPAKWAHFASTSKGSRTSRRSSVVRWRAGR